MENGSRVEVKTSLLSWCKQTRSFQLHFSSIKPGAHDILYLAWTTPRGVHVFQNYGRMGMSTSGKANESRGDNLVMHAPGGKRGYQLWTAAEQFLLKQCKYWGMQYVAFIEFAEGDADRVREFAKRACPAAMPVGDEGGNSDEEDSDEESGDDDEAQ
eukprot:4435518-Prymnesium_polylepis.1